jgi:formate hydrogenlyase transcriptional activator
MELEHVSEASQLSSTIIGASANLRQVLQQVELVARTAATVLIYGETGTGKELIARAVHTASSRARAPFVKLNCAALPATLFESELFGHEKGAFTGAVARRTGRFEQAEGGTIFLDEIGELPIALQPKLLRVLQERELERLGSTRTLKVDVRLVAATNRDLSAMVQERSFREDLYYRLAVFPVYVPPLRERRDDIPRLVEHFVAHFARHMNKDVRGVSARTLASFERYDWPGNVRELQNVIERAVILAPGPLLDLVPESSPTRGAIVAAAQQRTDALADVNRAHILSVLRSTNGVVAGPNGAAARLGMKRSTLAFRMRKLGIVRAADGYVALSQLTQ